MRAECPSQYCQAAVILQVHLLAERRILRTMTKTKMNTQTTSVGLTSTNGNRQTNWISNARCDDLTRAAFVMSSSMIASDLEE